MNKGQANRIKVIQHYSKGTMKCAQCGFDDIRALAIDHIFNDGAEHRNHIGNGIYRWLIENLFPEGFQVLCMNCNWIKHKISQEENHYTPHQMRQHLEKLIQPDGFRGLTASEAKGVLEKLANLCQEMDCKLTSKLFVSKAVPAYKSYLTFDADWIKILKIAIVEHRDAPRNGKIKKLKQNKQEIDAAEEKIIREISEKFPKRYQGQERVEEWIRRTEKELGRARSMKTFYNKVNQLEIKFSN